MEILEPYSLISEVELKKFESLIGASLPDDYKLFILKYNGGYPIPNQFYYQRKDKKYLGLVDWFLGFHNGDDDNIRLYFEIYKERIPIGYLPIAHDPGGNLICISLREENLSEIYFWDHESECDEGEIPSFENFHFISIGFASFLDELF